MHIHRWAGVLGFAALATLGGFGSAAESPVYDLAIRSGRILDGTGNPWFLADLGVTGGRIVAIGTIPATAARTVIDAKGLYVAPGFIDVHTHVDSGVLADPTVKNYLMQGVTTVVTGNCGESVFPLRDFFGRVAASGTALNVASLVGHNTIRREVMGDVDRAPTEAELARMSELVRQEMEAGAIGLSTGLAYVPGRYSTTEEIVRLARAIQPFEGIYATHMRNQGRRIREAIEEAVRVGREANVPVQVSHIKLAEEAVWGQYALVTEPLEAARQEGVEVYTDQYPYAATSSGFASSFPGWAVAGGHEAFVARMQDRDARERARQALIEKRLRSQRGLDPLERIYVAESKKHPEYDGKTLGQILRLLGREPTPDQAAELIVEMEVDDEPLGIFFQMDEPDVDALMALPYNMIASDGELAIPGKGSPHPRYYGTFPRVLGEYVRDRHVLGLTDAIRRMTSLPAQAMRFHDRGVLRPGMAADVVVFDAEGIRDQATFEQPHQYPHGVRWVIVNGQVAARDGQVVTPSAGRILRGGSRR